jgi:uncharacterized repeat protein (TIGR04076 family)
VRILNLAEHRDRPLDAREVLEVGGWLEEKQIHAALAHALGKAPTPLRVVEHGPESRRAASRCETPAVTDMTIYDLRVTVERIEGRSVCGLERGDYFEVTESSRVRIPPGRHFCLYALSAVIPLLPAKQRKLPDEDWLEQETFVACPDAEERLIMRIERIGERTMRSEDLT